MSRWMHAAGQLLVLFVFWVALSGQLDPLFLAMGAGAAALVTALTHEMLVSCIGAGGRRRVLRRAWRFAVYLVWLIGRIMVASVQIAYFIIHPRALLQPRVLRFRSQLRRPLARVMLANSITLVPGTLTLRLDDGEYTVHVLVPGAAGDLLNGKMQNMVGSVFLEPPEDAPVATWEPVGDMV